MESVINKRGIFYWKKYFIICLIMLFSITAVSQSIPDFTIQLTSGKLFTAKNLTHDKPVIIIYFSPDCEHCQVLMNEIFKRIQSFRKAQIIMATFNPMDEVIAFEKLHQTGKYPNIKVGVEKPIFFFRYYYQLENTPFTALYDMRGKLIVSYKKQTPVDDLLKHLDALR